MHVGPPEEHRDATLAAHTQEDIDGANTADDASSDSSDSFLRSDDLSSWLPSGFSLPANSSGLHLDPASEAASWRSELEAFLEDLPPPPAGRRPRLQPLAPVTPPAGQLPRLQPPAPVTPLCSGSGSNVEQWLLPASPPPLALLAYRASSCPGTPGSHQPLPLPLPLPHRPHTPPQLCCSHAVQRQAAPLPGRCPWLSTPGRLLSSGPRDSRGCDPAAATGTGSSRLCPAWSMADHVEAASEPQDL